MKHFMSLTAVLAALSAPVGRADQGSNQNDPFRLPNGSSPMEALEKLRQAVDSVQGSPEIKRLTRDGLHSLSVIQRVSGREVETTKFQDYYKGVEVVGSMAFHHRDGRGIRNSQIISHMKEFDLNVRPSISSEEAVAIAKAEAGERTLSGAPELKVLPAAGQNAARLVYWVSLQTRIIGNQYDAGHDLVIDAHTGRVIADISHMQTLAPVEVYATNDDCQTVDEHGTPLTLDYQSCDHVVKQSKAESSADDSALQAKDNSERVLSYYQDTHGRNSFDDQGTRAASVVHVGVKFPNAFWSRNDKIMGYGDGDGKDYGDFTKAVDVAGHEMTHAVVSSTAGLHYFGESGALNEAYADFFGEMIAPEQDWLIGREIFIKPVDGLAIRNLANPKTLVARVRKLPNGQKAYDPYPAHMKDAFKVAADEKCSRRNDNCWVHINSTIPSHAAYKVHSAIGREKAEKLYYTVLTQYLPSRADFKASRDETVRACRMLYDFQTCAKVEKSFAEVGL